MGLIRKSLYLGTGGVVAPNSKKQRQQKQMLAALQGATPEEVKRAGGRYDFNGFWGQPPQSVVSSTEVERPAGQAAPWPEAFPRPPRERGWKLASIVPSSGKPGECPRCHRTLTVLTSGKPHAAMGRKWCPGSTEFDYVYRSGYLYPVIEQQQGSTQEQHPEEPASAATASPTAADRLAEVSRLHDQGLLTDEEYQAKRAEIISGL